MNSCIWIILLLFCACGKEGRCNRHSCDKDCDCMENLVQPREFEPECKDYAMPLPVFSPEKECDCEK